MSEEEVRATIEELARYILSRFLSLAVNMVFTACCKASEEEEENGGMDETDGGCDFESGGSGALTVNPDAAAKLPAIFSDCGNHIALDYYRQRVQKLVHLILPELRFPEPLPEVDLDRNHRLVHR